MSAAGGLRSDARVDLRIDAVAKLLDSIGKPADKKRGLGAGRLLPVDIPPELFQLRQAHARQGGHAGKYRLLHLEFP